MRSVKSVVFYLASWSKNLRSISRSRTTDFTDYTYARGKRTRGRPTHRGMYGDLQGIAGKALHEIEGLQIPLLEGSLQDETLGGA